jgi:hypothetical protein
MKTATELSKELEIIAVEYDNKVDEIRERHDELLEANQNLILNYKGDYQFMVKGRPLLISDVMHGNDYPVEVLLKNIKNIEILLGNPRYYKPSKLIDNIKS